MSDHGDRAQRGRCRLEVELVQRVGQVPQHDFDYEGVAAGEQILGLWLGEGEGQSV